MVETTEIRKTCKNKLKKLSNKTEQVNKFKMLKGAVGGKKQSRRRYRKLEK